MLSYLKVSDLALVKEAEVEFTSGLNVLTGETGAGKTVLVGAIGLLLGDRADSGLVRTGAAEAVLEAVFDLSSSPDAASRLAHIGFLDEGEEELILGRRLQAGGKGKCTVNGRMAPVSALAEIGAVLLEIHGQNTHQALLTEASHLEYLDRFAGAGHNERLNRYTSSYKGLRSLEAEARGLPGSGGESTDREAAMLEHEVAEIDAAGPVEGELEELDGQAVRMRRAKELFDLASAVESAVREDVSRPGASELLGRAAAEAARMSGIDPTFEPLAGRLDSIVIEASDIAAEVASYRESLDLDPGSLHEAESRISGLRELCRKYGGSIGAVLSYREDAAARLEEIRVAASRAGKVISEIEAAKAEAEKIAGEVSKGRREAAGRLESSVIEQMRGLELSSAGFAVKVGDREGGIPLGPSGIDAVEFLFSPGDGEPLRPLKKIASGGEMSRVMLAIKIVLAEADRLPVLVFDEVDAGIGGETASAVGEKLWELTRYHQVFCVTHLPQIACLADAQYAVLKKGKRAGRTEVRRLDGKDRVAEMCRMLGDSTSREATERHAEDILDLAAVKKKSAGGASTPPIRDVR